ncbi:MAG TPA: L-seryl-tRNA selenium transferase [Dehalococcoidia bacterium]|nr:L-seryl-tRNA selenium transferase [Dehalococcoidia bacterium]
MTGPSSCYNVPQLFSARPFKSSGPSGGIVANFTTDASQAYQRLGVKPIINAAGSVTKYGGTRTRSEVLEVMAGAARIMVNVEDLNRKAGEEIARLTGAESGFVCSGAAGGLVLQAAACIAGTDPVKMRQLPDTTGMKDEIIIQNMHRFPYEQAYRAGGGKLVEIGDSRYSHPWELEGAIGEKTAAVAFLCAPMTNRRAIPLDQVCEIAHSKGVPVIVDAASMLPPRANLRKFLSQGADMVSYSGGKGIRGPQGTGILCGRTDLIEAAAAHANPAQFLGRPMKVTKEEVVGLVTALSMFVEEDEEAEMRAYRALAEQVVDALSEVPGLKVTLEHDENDYLIPHAVLSFGPEWNGPSRNEIAKALEDGDPPIYLHMLGQPDELGVDPLNLTEEETATVVRRLREELTRR